LAGADSSASGSPVSAWQEGASSPANLFRHAAFRAAGFYSLPAQVQNMVARWLGGPLGRIKVGHVLIAYGQKPARRSH